MMLKTGNRIGGQWVVVVACALWILAGAGVVQAAPGSFPLAFEARKGDHTITLLGTIHAGESKMYPMPRALYDALQASDALVFEIDIDPDALSGVESLLGETSRLPDETNLFEVLPSDMFFKLERKLQPYGIHLIEKLQFEPWFFSLIINSLPMVSGQLDVKQGVETHLRNRREVEEKPVLSLETLEEQVAYFRMESIEDQTEVLRFFLQSLDAQEESMDALLDAWKTGDALHFEQELTKLSGGDVPDRIQAFWAGLIHSRNRTMLNRMLALSDEYARLFVAVGTLHLVGPDGIVSGLEASGYRVERIIYKDVDVPSAEPLKGGAE